MGGHVRHRGTVEGGWQGLGLDGTAKEITDGTGTKCK
jgi:hypothetical protein